MIELWVPGIRRFPPGQTAVPFEVTERHTGFDTYDMTTQQGTSHHYSRELDGTYRYSTSNFRYVWPAECDLMAQLAGLERPDAGPTGPARSSPPRAPATSPHTAFPHI